MEKRFEEIMKNGKEKATILSDEEILYLLKLAAKKEASVRDELVTNKIFGDYEDIAHEIFTYLLSKDASGKQGIRWLQENQNIEHLKNSLFFFVRNEYNGNLRKNKINQLVFNTDSLDDPIKTSDNEKDSNSIMELVYDKFEAKNDIEEFESLHSILECVSDIENEKYYIRYKDKPASKFSFKKLVKIMFELYSGTQIKAKDLSEIIYKFDNNHYIEANKEEVNVLLSDLKKSLRINPDFIELIGKEI